MGTSSGQLVHVGTRRLSSPVEQLARWWTSATQAERFWLVNRAIKGDPEAPSLATLQIAIYLAEVEAGEVAEG